jgi:hypothetical protein
MLEKRSLDGRSTYSDFINLVNERSNIEENYAKQLEKLSKQFLKI